MMLFAHIGITLGLVWLPYRVVSGVSSGAARPKPGGDSHVGAPAGRASGSGRFRFPVAGPDYRLVLAGSMLPDIIDKPLGTWIMRDILSDGRVYSHTLLFSVVLLAIGLVLYATRGQWAGLWLAFGSIVHLCLDQMWLNPVTFLWPAFGWRFPVVDTSGWVERVFSNLFREPGVYVPEIIGFLLLAAFALDVIRRRKVVSFLRVGVAD